MTRIEIRDARTQLSRLLTRVEAGEEIVLVRSGTPIARLLPVQCDRPRTPGLLHGFVDDAFFDDLGDELEVWEEASDPSNFPAQ